MASVFIPFPLRHPVFNCRRPLPRTPRVSSESPSSQLPFHCFFSLPPRLPLKAQLASWLCLRVFVSFALLRLCQPSFYSAAQSDQRILTNITALLLTVLCYCIFLLEGKNTFFSLLPNITFFGYPFFWPPKLLPPSKQFKQSMHF